MDFLSTALCVYLHYKGKFFFISLISRIWIVNFFVLPSLYLCSRSDEFKRKEYCTKLYSTMFEGTAWKTQTVSRQLCVYMLGEEKKSLKGGSFRSGWGEEKRRWYEGKKWVDSFWFNEAKCSEIKISFCKHKLEESFFYFFISLLFKFEMQNFLCPPTLQFCLS